MYKLSITHLFQALALCLNFISPCFYFYFGVHYYLNFFKFSKLISYVSPIFDIYLNKKYKKRIWKDEEEMRNIGANAKLSMLANEKVTTKMPTNIANYINVSLKCYVNDLYE